MNDGSDTCTCRTKEVWDGVGAGVSLGSGRVVSMCVPAVHTYIPVCEEYGRPVSDSRGPYDLGLTLLEVDFQCK